MVKRKWIFEIVMVGAALLPARALAEHFEGFTTCEEFERGARFDVYEVIESLWKIFFFWGNNTEMHAISFGLPSQKRVEKFKTEVDVVDQHLGVEWNKAYLFMMPRPGVDVLLLYAGSPGIFRALVKTEDRKRGRPYPPPLLHFADVRMKLVDGFLGMMCCEDLTAYALATIDDMPQTEKKCREAAQFMNYTGHPGRSYLFVQRKIRQRAIEL